MEEGGVGQRLRETALPYEGWGSDQALRKIY